MSFEIIDGILNIELTDLMTLAIAAVVGVLGYWIAYRVAFIKKFTIPAPVVGGFIIMLITWFGHSSSNFEVIFDNSYQDFFMLAFFTTIGLGASLKLLKVGGKLLIIYWLFSCALSIIQNIVGVGVSSIVGLEPAYGLLASAIPLVGGHGAALSYGTTFEQAGYEAATLVGAASATYGLISAVLIGGPLANHLIKRDKITTPNMEGGKTEELSNSYSDVLDNEKASTLSSLDVFTNVAVILISMALGTIVSGWIGSVINMSFPDYVGAMFVAVIIRNLNDKLRFFNFNFKLVDGIGSVSLNLYLSMAMISMRLWELSDLIGGVLIVLIANTVITFLLVYFVGYRFFGKDYDAVVMSAGELGHGLGSTATAMVNMNAVTEKYGPSPKAFLIVPIVGSFLVDIIYQPQTIWFISQFVEL